MIRSVYLFITDVLVKHGCFMTICMKVQKSQYLKLGPCLTSKGHMHVTQLKSNSNTKMNLQLSLVIVAW